ncbi:MAG: undecaprenyl-phosphate glucose phosphotransferase [Planctomycetota bacterium]
MLKQHSQLMVTLLTLADACAVTVAWIVSYWIRFTWLPVDAAKGFPDFTATYLPMIPLIIMAHLIIFSRLRLYSPRRDLSVLSDMRDVIKAFAVSVIAVIIIDYALPRSNKISRQFIMTYAIMGTTLFALFRACVRWILHIMRRRGWNKRTAAIVGSGSSGQHMLQALKHNSWTGIEVTYFVDDPRDDQPIDQLEGITVRGPLSELDQIIEDHPVDSVFIALPGSETQRISEVMAALQTCMADVRLIPEIDPTFVMRPDVSQLEGLAILSLRQTPLYGWNAILKRGFDIVVGGLCLLIALVPMLLIAALIKLTSRGPVLYRQRRMGLDGREFTLVKFRTMRVDAEENTGPVWSRTEDPRRTRIGSFLRRTSLDELPNLLNVLAGHMSLVGPRPERPEFIRQFKHEIPRYMLRHRMKPGMTGSAQIKGYRGNTSLKMRIQHDVQYINNWSLALDLRILAQTLAKVWFSKHET